MPKLCRILKRLAQIAMSADCHKQYGELTMNEQSLMRIEYLHLHHTVPNSNLNRTRLRTQIRLPNTVKVMSTTIATFCRVFYSSTKSTMDNNVNTTSTFEIPDIEFTSGIYATRKSESETRNFIVDAYFQSTFSTKVFVVNVSLSATNRASVKKFPFNKL